MTEYNVPLTRDSHIRNIKKRHFLERLWHAVNLYSGGIFTWSLDGTKILMDENRFYDEVQDMYPGLVASNNVRSMQRYLNAYGFRTKLLPSDRHCIAPSRIRECFLVEFAKNNSRYAGAEPIHYRRHKANQILQKQATSPPICLNKSGRQVIVDTESEDDPSSPSTCSSFSSSPNDQGDIGFITSSKEAEDSVSGTTCASELDGIRYDTPSSTTSQTSETSSQGSLSYISSDDSSCTLTSLSDSEDDSCPNQKEILTAGILQGHTETPSGKCTEEITIDIPESSTDTHLFYTVSHLGSSSCPDTTFPTESVPLPSYSFQTTDIIGPSAFKTNLPFHDGAGKIPSHTRSKEENCNEILRYKPRSLIIKDLFGDDEGSLGDTNETSREEQLVSPALKLPQFTDKPFIHPGVIKPIPVLGSPSIERHQVHDCESDGYISDLDEIL